MEVQQPRNQRRNTSRLGGGAETDSQVERTHRKVVAGRPGKVVTGRLGKAQAGRVGGPTFMCR